MARRNVLGLWPRRAAPIVDTFLADNPRPLPVNLSERLNDSGMPKFNVMHCYEPGPHYEPGHIRARPVRGWWSCTRDWDPAATGSRLARSKEEE